MPRTKKLNSDEEPKRKSRQIRRPKKGEDALGGGPTGGYLTPKKTQTDRLDTAFNHLPKKRNK